MALTTLTFDQLKAAFLANARTGEFCKGFHAAQVATDENALIQSNIDAAIWLYSSGVVTDALLANLNQSNLNSNGIYSSGTFNLINPAGKIYVLGSANVTLNANGNNATELHALGSGSVNVNLSSNGFCELGTYLNASISVNAGGNSTLCLTSYEKSTANLILNNNTNAFITMNWLSNVALTGNDSSFANIRGYDKAILQASMAENATYQFVSFNNFKIVNNSLA